jgi:hypothetical protein
MLDYDLKTETEAVGFTRKYAKFHKLGSALTILTSEVKQMDLSLDRDNLLNRYSAVFGKIIDWQEARWYIQDAYRLKMVDKVFTALREFGSITIRVNPKNDEIPAPKIVDYFPNGDRTGVTAFLRHWAMCKKMG